MSNMRVLIVEDSLPLARLIAEYIRPVTSNIVIVADMEGAMKELGSVAPFDIVTLDLNLPDSNAEETRAKIRDIKKLNPDCIVVIITGMMNPDQERLCIEAGADGYMRKIDSVLPGRSTFVRTLLDIGKSIARVPERYQKNIPLLEELADKISTHAQNLKNPIA